LITAQFFTSYLFKYTIMEKMNDLRDLLKHEIEDLYSAEEQIIEALPKMIEKTSNKSLKASLNEHLKVTREQKKRLDKVQQMLEMGEDQGNGKRKGLFAGLFGGGKHVCKGMKGIIEEGNKIIEADMSEKVRDAAIIASSQKVEHYEICGYGTARTYANELNLREVAGLLQQTLDEEYEADKLLSKLAEEKINVEAETNTSLGNNAPGQGSARSNRSVTRERAEERELEMVSNRGKGSAKSSESDRMPRSSGTPRGNTSGRTAAQKKTAAGSRGTKTTSRSSSARSSSGGRGGNGSGRTGRGRS
jgi:ferritin-like metal-binding protein YciE